MKHLFTLLISLLVLSGEGSEYLKEKVPGDQASDNTLTVYYSPDLNDLVNKWISEYRKNNQGIEIRIIDVTKNFPGESGNGSEIGFISGNYSSYYHNSMWNTVVGRDVLIPIFNSRNPFADEISKTGITLEKLRQVVIGQGDNNWGSLLGSSDKTPFKIHMVDDKLTESAISGLTGSLPPGKGVIKEAGKNDLISSIQADLYSIGILNMTDFPNAGSPKQADISLLPIDRNGNGEIDYMEEIYDDTELLSRGIWMGKYPKVLLNNVYSVSSAAPRGKNQIAFLTWVLSDGQEYLGQYGFSELLLSERQSKIEILGDDNVYLAESKAGYNMSGIAILLVGLLAIIIVSYLGIKVRRRSIAGLTGRKFFLHKVFDENAVDILPGLYYDKSHTWAFMEKDGMVRIGIDDFLQRVTGPLTRVIMKEPGEKVVKGKPVLTIIQNGKQLKIYAPLSGTITESNQILKKDSSVINSSPYSNGWIYRIEPSRWLNEIDFLFIGKKYREWISTEFDRLKEFLLGSLKNGSNEYAHVLQDGGELKDGILLDMSPETWEDFQTNFIDQSR